MARLLLIVKILPTGTDVDLDEVVNSIKQNLTDRIELKQYQKTKPTKTKTMELGMKLLSTIPSFVSDRIIIFYLNNIRQSR